jgi:hypothetical protein
VRRLRRARRENARREKGQGLVEFTLVLPIILLVVVSVSELGLAYGRDLTIGYGSREGARVGSALATGNPSLCSDLDRDPSGVDVALIAAVQRILKSPGSDIDISQVQQIRIFKATASGSETPGTTSVWTYLGEGLGPGVDAGPPASYLDFGPPASVAWPACDRVNSGATPDSIGVTVVYRYEFVTPMPSVLNAIAGGDLGLTLSQTTIMSLNPTA